MCAMRSKRAQVMRTGVFVQYALGACRTVLTYREAYKE